MSLLRFDQVACVRRGRMLFEGLCFALGPGEAMIVTGPNGVGKSSLIRIAAGLLPRATGRVERESPPALLTEAAALDPERTLAQALGFWAKIDSVAPSRIDEALADLDLTDLADIPVRLLSTGQRRRAALARVLASPGSLWLLDEPANGLDATAVARLETLIARHRESGGAALIATHQPIAAPDAQAITLELQDDGHHKAVRAEPVEALPSFFPAGNREGQPPSAGWQSQPLRTGFDKLRANGQDGEGGAK